MDRREFLSLAAAGIALKPVRNPQSPDPWVEINAAYLAWNLRQIQSRVGSRTVMAVVKANGYGHGLVEAARELAAAGVRHFLVAKLDEAVRLRQSGVRGQVFNFGPFGERDAAEIIRRNICQNVYTRQVDALDKAAQKLGRPARVQIKVDTGLGRLGVPYDRALDFIERVAALRGIVVQGIFTTLTEDREFDVVQIERFSQVSGAAARIARPLGLRHAASSAAILDQPRAYTELDMVRPGIMLYGLYPSERAERERKLELKPVLSLKARIGLVKTLRAGESVSYHRVYTAEQPERVATLPVGYADGFPKTLAGIGSVLVAGKRCPIVAVTANATVVRLGETPAAEGDEAVLIGEQGSERIPAAEIGRLTKAGVYSTVIGLSPALPRVVRA